MRRRIVALAIALAGVITASVPMTANAAVYVEDTSGNVDEYADIPALPISGNVHIEYVVGIVTAASGDGTVIYSTDADDAGILEDVILWRIDITE